MPAIRPFALVVALLAGTAMTACQSQSQSSGGQPQPPSSPSSPSMPSPSSVPSVPGTPGTPGTPGMPAPPAPPSTDGGIEDATDVFEDARNRRESGESGDASGDAGDRDETAEAGAEGGGLPGDESAGDDDQTADAGGPTCAEDDPDCDETTTGTTGSGTPAGGDEQVAAGGGTPCDEADPTCTSGADGAFERALEDFDGAILAERGTIISSANETAAGDPRADEGRPSARGGIPAVPGSGNGSAPDASGLPLPKAPETPPPPPPSTAQMDIPKDIPDARDDDVVARQLREAAMQETDPVLREKLWEEYRRYKSGS